MYFFLPKFSFAGNHKLDCLKVGFQIGIPELYGLQFHFEHLSIK